MTGVSGGRRRGMRVSRRAAVLAPLLLPLVVLPAAKAASLPRLAGTTTLTTTSTSTTTVRVTRAATLVVNSGAQSPNVAVTASAGRLAGFVLTALARPDIKVPALIAMQVGMCSQPRCRPTAPYAFHQYIAATGLPERRLSDTATEVTLPAGDYVVRAVTDGAPVRMTIRLAGLSGATTMKLTRPFRAELRTDASTSSVAAGIDPLRNVGVSHDFASDSGFMMDTIFVNYDPHVRSEWGYCLYRGDAKPPTGYYHPECPGAETGTWIDFQNPTLQYRGVLYGADIALLPGKWTRGYYLTGVGGASSLTVVTLWFDLT